MNMMVMLLAALALIPQPRELKETGGTCPVGTKIEYVQDSSIQKEGYRLSVAPNAIRIASADAAGRFYAEQTLEQLKNGKVYACAEINDWPEYVWRGVLVDEGRHFLGRETVKHIIDTIAHHKLNVLHWHLTEDQGWRIDVPGLPELAKYGSVRPSSPKYGADLKWTGSAATGHSSEQNGDQYGPFYYTEAELRDVVAYAESKHVTIVPEIDMPGHMRGAIAAYPNLTCFPEHITTRMAYVNWGVMPDVLCMGNDEVLPFVKKVLDFVCDVFPSKVIHIGGDECPRLNWEKCPKCQARMKAEGLKEPGELQTWFTRQVVAYLESKGRRADGWDEYLNGDVPKSAIGQSWRTQSSNGAELMKRTVALDRGHDIIVSPHTECYYNYHQDVEDDPYQYIGGRLPLKRAYDFDPMTGLPASARRQVLGSEACVWGEWVWNRYDFDWKLWPRGCAMAEILWTNPKVRDLDDLVRRLVVHRKRLVRNYVNCAPIDGASKCEASARGFGALSDGRVPKVYTLQGIDGLRLDVSDYGGRVLRVYAPDRNGNLADVTLGFNTAAEYERHRNFCFGTLIGRFGNRIRDGRFTLDGKDYQLAINESTATRHCNLHSGPHGWDDRLWKVRRIDTSSVAGLELSLVSEDGDMGFPGRVECKVTYRVLPGNVWRIDIEATTDKATVVNPINHSYWNMAGEASGAVLGQELQIFADEYMKTDAGLIPLQAVSVKGTGFDFTEPCTLASKRDWMASQKELACTDNWYDHCFVLRGKSGEMKPAAKLRDPVSGRQLEIWTTETCLQMYGAQNFDGSFAAKEAGKKQVQFAGVALETQHAPDSPNHPEWPSVVLRPGEKFRSTTEFRFSAQ